MGRGFESGKVQFGIGVSERPMASGTQFVLRKGSLCRLPRGNSAHEARVGGPVRACRAWPKCTQTQLAYEASGLCQGS